MDKIDDKDLLEVNWLGQSEDIVNDMIGVNNTSRAMLVGVGVPGVTAAIAVHRNALKAADIGYIMDIGHNTMDFVEHINNSREKASAIMAVKDDVIKNSDTGVTSVTLPVVSQDCKFMYYSMNHPYEYIRDHLLIEKYDRVNLDKNLSSSMMIQKIKQYCAQHRLSVFPSKINKCMQHAKKHGYYFSADLK